MESPHRYNVFFQADLSPEELEARLQAIRLINGVEHIESSYTGPLVPDEAPKPSTFQPQEQPPPLPGVVIEQALVWGLKQSLITAAQVHQKSPEELIQTALSMLDKMPEALMRDISKSITP